MTTCVWHELGGFTAGVIFIVLVIWIGAWIEESGDKSE